MKPGDLVLIRFPQADLKRSISNERLIQIKNRLIDWLQK
jgi:hypothetical protein